MSNYCRGPSVGFHQGGREGGVGGSALSQDDMSRTAAEGETRDIIHKAPQNRNRGLRWRVSSVENLHFHLRLWSERERKRKEARAREGEAR